MCDHRILWFLQRLVARTAADTWGRLTHRIEVSRRLVQNHEGARRDERSGEGEPLALAHRKTDAALADQGVPTIGQSSPHIVKAGELGGIEQSGRILRVFLAKFEVFKNGAGYDHWLLRNPRDLFPQ